MESVLTSIIITVKAFRTPLLDENKVKIPDQLSHLFIWNGPHHLGGTLSFKKINIWLSCRGRMNIDTIKTNKNEQPTNLQPNMAQHIIKKTADVCCWGGPPFRLGVWEWCARSSNRKLLTSKQSYIWPLNILSNPKHSNFGICSCHVVFIQYLSLCLKHENMQSVFSSSNLFVTRTKLIHNWL